MYEVIRFLGYKVMRLGCCLVFWLVGCWLVVLSVGGNDSKRGDSLRVLSIKY